MEEGAAEARSVVGKIVPSNEGDALYVLVGLSGSLPSAYCEGREPNYYPPELVCGFGESVWLRYCAWVTSVVKVEIVGSCWPSSMQTDKVSNL